MSKAIELSSIVLDGQLPLEDFKVAVEGLNFLTQQKMLQFPDQSVCSLCVVGTAGTDNPLGSDPNFMNISVWLRQELFNLSLLARFRQLPQPGNAPAGDFISAVSLGVHRVREFLSSTKKTYRPQLTCLVGGSRTLPGGFEDLQRISRDATVPMFDTTFVVFGDVEQGMLDILRGFESCRIITAKDWLRQVRTFHSKPVAQVAKCKAGLNFGPGCEIPVNVYIKVKAVSMPTLKKKVKGDKSDVRMDRVYADAGDISGRAIPKEELTKAYKYGKIYVPITEYEKVHIHLETAKCLTVLATIPQSQIPPNRWMGPAELVISDPGNVDAAENLSGIIHALQNLGLAILARFVARPNSEPKLVALFPFISEETEYLSLVPLPFTEDSRESILIFPQLPTPTDKQQACMDDLVDALTLPSDSIAVGYQPALQRYWHTLFHRLLNPRDLDWRAGIDEDMQEQVFPEFKLHAKTQEQLDAISSTFPTELKPDPVQRRRVDHLMAVEARKKDALHAVQPDQVRAEVNVFIGTVDPVSDFTALLTQPGGRLKKHEAMADVIRRIVSDGGSSALLEKAFNSLVALRDDAATHDDVQVYNQLLPQLMKEFPGRKKFWESVSEEGLTVLVDSEEADRVSRSIEELARGVVQREDYFIDDLE